MNQTLKGFITALGLDIMVVSLLDFLKDQGKEHGKKLVEGWILGLGTNDEVLFQSACSYAVLELQVPIAEINKIVSVIKEYSNSENERIIEIIGKSEQEVTIKVPVLDKDGNIMTEKKTGKPIFKETKVNANIKGAQILAVLAKMSEQEMKDFFEASGALNTPGKKVGAIGKQVSAKVKQALTKASGITSGIISHPATQSVFDFIINTPGEIRDSFNSALDEPTAFEKIGYKLDIFGLSKLFNVKRRV